MKQLHVTCASKMFTFYNIFYKSLQVLIFIGTHIVPSLMSYFISLERYSVVLGATVLEFTS